MKLINKRRCIEFPSSVNDADVAVVFDRWADLLPEMLVKIFSYLDVTDKLNVALVYRDWRAAVYVPSLWSKMMCRVEAMRLTDSRIISTLVDRGVRRIEILDAFEGRISNIRQIGEIVAAMPNIEHLDVSDCGRMI